MGDGAAPMLQEAGYAAGDDFFEGFRAWLEEHANIQDPADLDANSLGLALSGFFEDAGWGRLELARLGDCTLRIVAPEWAESEDSPEEEVPSCHVTTGLLAAFLGRIASDLVAVMEVECRTRGDDHCSFLAGAPETLEAIYEGIADGTDYESLLTAQP